MPTPIIEIKNLNAGYDGRIVLHDVNLTVYERDFLGIIGPNGGGKTTLIKCILGLLKPFGGEIISTAHIGYLPQGRVVGLSKIARVVETVAKRPQLQERMTETIANLLMEKLNARGVGVVIEATHSCMTLRGIKKPGSLCVTSAMKGSFRDYAKTRAEFLKLALRRK